MSRSRVNYQSESLFVCRDSHISHFRDGAVFAEEDEGGDLFPIIFDGEEYNSRRNLPFNHPNGNLVEQLQRIQSINFDINIPIKDKKVKKQLIKNWFNEGEKFLLNL